MLNTATGYLALLQENDIEFKSIALDKLNLLVDEYWSEISDYIKTLKGFYERKEIPEKQELLALILSKIYYNLEDYSSAIEWALESGKMFNIAEKSLYVETILKKMLDKYITICRRNFSNKDNPAPIDPRISSIVEMVFNTCLVKKQITQAIGFSLESYDLDRLGIAIESNQQIQSNLRYVYELILDVIVNNDYKMAILKELLRLYTKHANTYYMDISNCQFLLNNSAALAGTLFNILRNEEDPLIAYQIAFDLIENQNPSYLRIIIEEIRKITAEKEVAADKMDKLLKILSGEISRSTITTCLSKKNNTDTNQLKNLIKAVEKGGSVVHLGVILCNSLLNSHTCQDSFLKENMEWVAKASNWSRFIATSSLGAIHMGNFAKGQEVMKPYLPGNPNISSIYAHGGAYYGLGLIYANSNDQVILTLLLNALNQPSNNKETIQHGIYLAIGLVAMGSHDLKLYEQLRDGVYTDDAIIGEAAGYAAGLVMAGSRNSQAIDDLVKYTHDTQHEKIIRAIALALALIVYGAEEGADSLVEQLLNEKDPILRYGATYCIGMAYAGTGNTTALKRLIKISVSDVSDDVRRAALINMGFLLIRSPDILFDNMKVISLLSESYNSNVRYGAVMAIGIAYAGSSKYNPYKIIQPLFTDPNYLVRQASLLASGMIFSQTTTAQEPNLSSFKENLTKILSDKDEHVLIRFGALLSQGFMELGGRNCTLNFVSSTGTNKMSSIIGMALFTQYYYWFPMIHFVNLAVNPTLLIGVDLSLKVVTNYSVLSKAKPSIYGYPVEPLIQEKAKVVKTETAVLSTHSRVKAKGRKTNTVTLTELKPSPSGEIPSKDTEEKKPSTEDKKEGEEKKAEEKKVEEPTEERLTNPIRIIPRQQEVIAQIQDQDFLPIIQGRRNGFVLLKMTKESAIAQYEDSKEVPIEKKDNKEPSAAHPNQYQPLPTDDVEMPEDIDVTNIK